MGFISRLCKGFIMTLSMFSIVPASRVWDVKACNLMLAMLPIVGAVIGALWYGFCALLVWLLVPHVISAALILLFPLFLTGFLHMDGYMDTCDAVFSRKSLDKSRAILKDPHAGAFGVIAVCVYLLIGFSAVYTALDRSVDLRVLMFIPILPRFIASVFALNMKPIWENGFVAAFKENTKTIHTVALAVMCALCLAAGVFTCGINAIVVMCIALVSATALCVYSTKQLAGISGDLCGFAITGGELISLLALALM